jgi:hypothetical protein
VEPSRIGLAKLFKARAQIFRKFGKNLSGAHGNFEQQHHYYHTKIINYHCYYKNYYRERMK